MYKVRLTKFIETATIRFHLERTVVMPSPQIGWIIHGYTALRAISLVVNKICWNADTQVIECILEPGTLDKTDYDARAYLLAEYGSDWKIGELFLTLAGLNAHVARLDALSHYHIDPIQRYSQ